MVTYTAPFRKSLRTKLHIYALRRHFPSSSSIFHAVLVILLCTVFSRLVLFFLPLVISTSICCAAVHLLAASERGAAEEVVLVSGEEAQVGLLQVYDEANMSVYGGGRRVEVGCFLLRSGGGWTKRGVDEDGDDVVFAGRLSAGGQCGVLEEDLVSLKVDRLAEGVWNSYFGRCSNWNYVTAGTCDEDNHIELM